MTISYIDDFGTDTLARYASPPPTDPASNMVVSGGKLRPQADSATALLQLPLADTSIKTGTLSVEVNGIDNSAVILLATSTDPDASTVGFQAIVAPAGVSAGGLDPILELVDGLGNAAVGPAFAAGGGIVELAIDAVNVTVNLRRAGAVVSTATLPILGIAAQVGSYKFEMEHLGIAASAASTEYDNLTVVGTTPDWYETVHHPEVEHDPQEFDLTLPHLGSGFPDVLSSLLHVDHTAIPVGCFGPSIGASGSLMVPGLSGQPRIGIGSFGSGVPLADIMAVILADGVTEITGITGTECVLALAASYAVIGSEQEGSSSGTGVLDGGSFGVTDPSPLGGAWTVSAGSAIYASAYTTLIGNWSSEILGIRVNGLFWKYPGGPIGGMAGYVAGGGPALFGLDPTTVYDQREMGRGIAYKVTGGRTSDVNEDFEAFYSSDYAWTTIPANTEIVPSVADWTAKTSGPRDHRAMVYDRKVRAFIGPLGGTSGDRMAVGSGLEVKVGAWGYCMGALGEVALGTALDMTSMSAKGFQIESAKLYVKSWTPATDTFVRHVAPDDATPVQATPPYPYAPPSLNAHQSAVAAVRAG